MDSGRFWKVVAVIGIAEFATGILDVAIFNQPIYMGTINVILGTGLILIAMKGKEHWDKVEAS